MHRVMSLGKTCRTLHLLRIALRMEVAAAQRVARILQACVLVRLSTSTAYRLGMMSYVVCCLGESILPAVFHFQKALK